MWPVSVCAHVLVEKSYGRPLAGSGLAQANKPATFEAFPPHAPTPSPLVARACKTPDEVRQCDDLVTLQRGQTFEAALQREAVTG